MPRIILHDAQWYSGSPGFANYVTPDGREIALKPRNGRYDSTNWKLRRAELAALANYTEDPEGAGFVISSEWIQPFDRSDSNLPGWLFHGLSRYPKASWCIFYDPILALQQRGLRAPLDLSKPAHRALWEGDLRYLARYAGHPQYWRLDGRPVIWVWAVHSGVVNAAAEFEAAREDWYLVGDVFGSSRPAVELPPLDAASGFVAALPTSERRSRAIDNFRRKLLPEFERWGAQMEMIPAFSLQYDEIAHVPRTGKQILARGYGELAQMLELAEPYMPTIEGRRYIELGTTNIWFEGSSVLPTQRSGPRFFSPAPDGIPPRIGNYRKVHLRVIRDVLFR